MKLFSDFGKGFSNCFKAFSVIFEKGLWMYLFYPVIIWILIWLATFYGLMTLSDYLLNWLKSSLSIDSITSGNSWLSFLTPKVTGAFGFLIKWLLSIVFWFIGSIFSKYLLLIILSPVFSLLSERADEKISGSNFPFSISQLIKDIVRGTLISLRNLSLELLLSFVLWIIALFFPPLALITIPLSFIIGWYFVGFSMLDYSCERHKLSISKGVKFIQQNKGYAIGIGCVYSVFMALPTIMGDVLGMMFGPAIAVVGATLSFLEIRKNANVN